MAALVQRTGTKIGRAHLAGLTWQGSLGRAHLAGLTWQGSLGRAHLAGLTWQGSPGEAHLAGLTWQGSLGRDHLAEITWQGSPGEAHLAGLTGRSHLGRLAWPGIVGDGMNVVLTCNASIRRQTLFSTQSDFVRKRAEFPQAHPTLVGEGGG